MNKILHEYTIIDDIKPHYIESGSGLPLLLIHGGGALSCAEINYSKCMEYLSNNFRVIAPDVVGFGLTKGKNNKIYSATEQGEFIIKFINKLGLDSIYIGGNSHGGWLVQYISHRIPKIVKKLIIINSLNGCKGIPSLPEGEKYIYGPKGHAHPEPTYDNVKNLFLNLYYDHSLINDNLIKKALSILNITHKNAVMRAKHINRTVETTNQDLNYEGKHISNYAHLLEMPILLPWGKDDPSMKPDNGYPCEYGWKYYKKLNNAEMYVIPRAKHHVFTDRAERWSDLVSNFLLSNNL